MEVVKSSLVEKALSKKEADIPSINVLRRRLQKAFGEFEETWLNEYISTLSTTVDTGYGTQVDLVLNAPDKDAIIALGARDEAKRRATLELRGIDSFANISKTHTERIMKEIQKGVEANLTVDQIARNIADTYRDPEAMRAKARTIARTETLTAISLGQAAAMGNAKEVIGPELRKAWITANDERVREEHTHAQEDGAIKTDEPFSNGLMFPRDPTGKPESTINCRCGLVMIPPGVDFDEL